MGSGGREHGLAIALGCTAEVVVAPGNPGIPDSVATDPEDLEADLFVIGPEQPLVDGLADRLRAAGRRVLGPGADGARVEGSKAYMKELVGQAGVPTARYGVFSEVDPALAFLQTLPGLYVVKTDGLTAGKGVLVTESFEEAAADVRDKLSGLSFGAAGRTVVIEEGLTGPEASVFAICDGTRAVTLPPAQDFKRLGDGDAGPNTGGMGAWSPVPVAGVELGDEVVARFVEPTLAALRARGVDYRGVLYAGLMLTPDGPKLIEYNVRFGDPDSQVVLLRVTSDLAELLAAAADGDLGRAPPVTTTDDVVVAVVAASDGYPVAPRTGDRIEGLEAARAIDGAEVLCAGVALDDEGHLITDGGRVLNVVGRGPDSATARRRAYEAMACISWPGLHHRADIAAP
ncbi:phosphoribosylamine--glycine ligase [Iamia sp.]|uniref:phosphoribosylamine--glycine ligase n=1 Tax=Iamia sp. TaxID=2722710 RepID=UPI002CF153EF|nr:phosphoribosylamine--glycine ligase [Iamia sp.]HXH57532.1 phosphoribosylamine--glycine ligase [Iamia sp.]